MDKGFPVIWWLWWFVAATVIYAILMVWFWRVGRRDSKDTSHQQDNAEPTA
jgi:hypothetical protein